MQFTLLYVYTRSIHDVTTNIDFISLSFFFFFHQRIYANANICKRTPPQIFNNMDYWLFPHLCSANAWIAPHFSPVRNNKLTNCDEHRLANIISPRISESVNSPLLSASVPRSKSRTLSPKQIAHSDQVDSTVNIAILTCLNCFKLLQIRNS